MSGHALEHALGADVFVDVWPMNAMTIANEFPVRSLRECCFRESPRPCKWNTNDASVNQTRSDRVVRYFNVSDSIFNADRSAHARPQ